RLEIVYILLFGLFEKCIIDFFEFLIIGNYFIFAFFFCSKFIKCLSLQQRKCFRRFYIQAYGKGLQFNILIFFQSQGSNYPCCPIRAGILPGKNKISRTKENGFMAVIFKSVIAMCMMAYHRVGSLINKITQHFFKTGRRVSM